MSRKIASAVILVRLVFLFGGMEPTMFAQGAKQKPKPIDEEGNIPRPVPPTSWMAIGQNSRPPWVSASAERRLRLLQALPAIEATLTTQVSGYFASSGPGMSVGLVLDDGLYFSRGFGFRDLQKSQVPDEETVYCTGSLTKVFTSTTLLTLRDAGTLSLNDDASKYVPEIKNVGAPQSATGNVCGPVKLVHLVSHTAGLVDEMDAPPLVAPNVNEPEWIQQLQKTQILFCPGNFSAYSGVDAETVAVIIERVTNQPYTTAVRDRLLNPLGMTHTVFNAANVDVSRKAQNWAQSWNASFTTPLFAPNSNWFSLNMRAAAGDLFSSVWDLARFHKMWLAAKEAPAGILKETTLQNSGQNVVPPSTMAIPPNCATLKDKNGWKYSGCENAAAYGVDWKINSPPFIWHNGNVPFLSGSHSVLNPSQKIGATGLISTEPFPAVPNNPNSPNNPTQPAGTDPNFMGTVVQGMLNTAQAADTPTDWSTSPLAVGVARLLWLLGAKRPASTIGCFPRPHPGPHGPYEPRTNPPCDKKALQNFADSLLVHFGRVYVRDHHLSAESVIEHVENLRQSGEACATFRVRGAPAPNRVQLRLVIPAKLWALAGTPERRKNTQVSI